LFFSVRLLRDSVVNPLRSILPLVLLLVSAVASLGTAAEPAIAIRSDFPGGNVIVVKNVGAQVELKPDLRGGQPWFYWHFEASASEAGKATFTFPGSPIIGVRGPAYSVDGGKTWQWLGAEHCTYDGVATPVKERRESFVYEFKPEQLKVRFAVAIPYLPENLKEFTTAHAGNPHLKQEFIAKTRNGTPVEMLVVGEPGQGREAMIVTARHHACESMASYVLEGFISEAMSETTAGVEFRKRFVLFAVPMVDRDGVAAGDQGKNRDPHDHNRDYGPKSIYPEVAAIQELGEAQDVKYAIDFHCPALRGDIHEAFHFLGLGTPRMKENLDRYIAWIKEERPQLVMTPLNYLTDDKKPNAVNPKINSHHFALRKNSVLAATLEVPYTQPNLALDPAMAREYGRGMLRAWVRTTFARDDVPAEQTDDDNGALLALRVDFLKFYRSDSARCEQLMQQAIKAHKSSPVFAPEVHLLSATMQHHQKRYRVARGTCEVVLSDPNATTFQRITASLLRLQIMADNPDLDGAKIDSLLADFLKLPYPANDQLAKAYAAVAKYHFGDHRFAKAIEVKRRQVAVAAPYETGKVLLELADFYNRSNEPAGESIKVREEAVAILRERLSPKPQRSIFGAMMTLDLFDALCGIPTATLAEKQAAAKLVLEHEVVAEMYKARVRKKLAELEAEKK